MDAPVDSPRFVVLAGPNGAGKTTVSRSVIGEQLGISHFVNADIIAQGLSGFSPESVAMAAGRLMLKRMDELAAARASFAIETTLSTRSIGRRVGALRANGYECCLVFLWLRSPELAIERVARRVELGGHDVPEETIRRRYRRGLAAVAGPLRGRFDQWAVYDNSGEDGPVPVADGEGDVVANAFNDAVWRSMIAHGKSPA